MAEKLDEFEKLNQEIAEKQARLEELKAERMAVKNKLLNDFFDKKDSEKLRQTLKEIGSKYPKKEQKQLAKIFDWWDSLEVQQNTLNASQDTNKIS